MTKKPVNSNPTKEFFSLLKSIEKNTKNQARISSYNPDDISSFMVEICPIKGVYQHAKFLFQIQLMLYPREFPNVICLSDIYHPNIEHGEDYHNVCLNLFDNWNRSFGLMDVIQGLIFLLYQPNLSDPISSFFNSKNTNEEIFRKNVYTSLHGGIIDGIEFLPNPGIIEYNETLKRKNMAEPKIIVEKIEEKCEINQQLNINDISEERKNGIVDSSEDSDKEEELITVMRNNNAAQVDMGECQESECQEIIDIIATVDNGDDEQAQSELDEEIEENLPTRAILSPNAFYSDLICSRYAQPDKLFDNEYGSNDLYNRCVFDLFGFPSSSYDSTDSEICDAFDSYYGDSDDCDDDDDDDDDDDIEVEFVRSDEFLLSPTNSQDPSTIFLRKWMDLRLRNNWSKECPAPMTSIILTNILNPFRPMVGVFYLCDMHNHNNNWRFSEQSVYRVERNDRILHLMVWAQNLCRWTMARQWRASYTECGCDQLLWYTLFLTLSYKVHSRLTHLYNYNSDHFVCHYID